MMMTAEVARLFFHFDRRHDLQGMRNDQYGSLRLVRPVAVNIVWYNYSRLQRVDSTTGSRIAAARIIIAVRIIGLAIAAVVPHQSIAW